MSGLNNNNNPVGENSNSGAGGELSDKITIQGDLVRQLKGDKKPKEEIDAAVKTLLALKVRTLHQDDVLLKSTFRPTTRQRLDLIGSQQEELQPRRRRNQQRTMPSPKKR